MDRFVISIGRQLGSGGREIGKKLAAEFGIRFLDSELITLAAKESGFGAEFFRDTDEKKGFFNTLFNRIQSGVSFGGYYDNQLSEEALFKIQSDAIRKIADEESCAIVGRCADYILRDNPRCISVFITASHDERVKRICERQNVDAEKAERMMERGDAERANYYNYYSTKTWGEAATYDLCINSSVMGIDETVAFIRHFVEKKLGGQ